MTQIRSALRSEDPNLAISEVTTLGEVVERSLGREKLRWGFRRLWPADGWCRASYMA
jgi:hypothetical protein